MADYGIKISQEGYDVKTCADLNLILKSDFTLLKVKASGTADTSTGFAQIYHGLGYKPQFLVYGIAEYPGDDPSVVFMETSNPLFEFNGVFAGVDDNYLYIYSDIYIPSSYYFIFFEGI